MAQKELARYVDVSNNTFLPLNYESLKGRYLSMPLFHYQHLCQALEILDQRLACGDGCIDISKDPDLAKAYNSLSLAVVAHEHWQDPLSICNHIQTAVRAKFLPHETQTVASLC